MSLATTTEQRMGNLAFSLKNSPPFTRGVIPLSPETSILFYGKDGAMGRVNSLDMSEDDIRYLADVCDPATFGLNQQDVLDETYRKAGKLDSANFAMKFNVESSGIIEAIRAELLEEEKQKRRIRAELYKLNVYALVSIRTAMILQASQGYSSRRFHVRLTCHCLPAHHEGGSLGLRYNDKGWTFDSASILSESSQPSIAYIAFYSDVEHEVIPVTSGHRVTVTYNLYFVDETTTVATTPDIPRYLNPQHSAFEAALRDLLSEVHSPKHRGITAESS